MPPIAHVIHRMVKAGAHRYILNLCLNRLGALVIVTNQHRYQADPEAISWFADNRIGIFFVKDFGANDLRDVMQNWKIRIILSHTRAADLYIRDNRSRLGDYGLQHWAIMLQGSWLEAKSKDMGNFKQEFSDTMHSCDRILDPSPSQHRPLLRAAGIASSKIQMVKYAVASPPRNITKASRTAARLPPKPHNAIVFAHISRMVRHKGPYISLELVRQLTAADYHAELLFFGDGDEYRHLNAASLPSNVYVFPGVPNPQTLANLYDCGLHPSVYKGEVGPMAPLEHATMQKPTVGTNIANTNQYLGTNSLTVNWLGRNNRVLSDSDIATALFHLVIGLFYKADKTPDYDEIKRRGLSVHAHQQLNYAIANLLQPYRLDGALVFGSSSGH